MSPKTDQSVLDQCKVDYASGNWKSVSELASRYNINLKTLHGRIAREGWDVKREELSRRVEKKVEETKVDLASQYLLSTKKRMEKYERMIDVSQSQNGSIAPDGITPLLDPDSLDTYSRCEARINAISLSALRIAQPVSQVQVTGSISMVSVIQQLREAKEKPALTSEDVSKYIDVEILPKSPSST